MKTRIYNSKYEIQPRIMLITISSPGRYFSVDELLVYDFMAIYGKEFLEVGLNLHGENMFKYSELAARRLSIEEAVKILVRKRLLHVDVEDGFRYSATDEGIERFSEMDSSYAHEYSNQLRNVLEYYSDSNEQELEKLIYSKSIK